MLYRLPVSFQGLKHNPGCNLLFVSRLFKKYGCFAKRGMDLALEICTGSGLGFDNICEFPYECLEVSILLQNQRLIEESFAHAVSQAPDYDESYNQLPRYLFNKVAATSNWFNHELENQLEWLLLAPRLDSQSQNHGHYNDWIAYSLYQQFVLSKVSSRDSIGLYSTFCSLRQCTGKDIITTADGNLVMHEVSASNVPVIRRFADKYAKFARMRLENNWSQKVGPSYFLYNGPIPRLEPPVEC